MNALLAPVPTVQPDPRVERSRPALAAFQQTRISPPALIGVALVHAGLLGLMVFMPKAPEQITAPRPLMVSLIKPPIEERQPKIQPRPRPPKPVVKPVVKPAPVLAAKPTPAPLPVIEAPEPTAEPAPEPVAEPSSPARAIEAAPPAPAPAPLQPSTPAHPADYLANPKPPYPALSKRLGEEGTVRLNILVNPDGSVAQLELLESSGHPRLDRSAIATVRSQWKFEPARQGGKAVAAWVIVPIQFTLRS